MQTASSLSMCETALLQQKLQSIAECYFLELSFVRRSFVENRGLFHTSGVRVDEQKLLVRCQRPHLRGYMRL